MSSSNVELLSSKKNLNKTIKMLRINDGLNIFIEDDRVTFPGLEDLNFLQIEEGTSKWETEFELQKHRFTI